MFVDSVIFPLISTILESIILFLQQFIIQHFKRTLI